MSRRRSVTCRVLAVGALVATAGLDVAVPASARPGSGESAGAVAQACTITGTAGPDTLVGTAGNDVICGLDGADRIRGLGGNDTIMAGGDGGSVLGNNINPGPGDDTVVGGSGRDFINCANASSCTGMGDGNDTIRLGAGNDGGMMGSGHDVVQAGSGADAIWGEGGNDELHGGTLGGDVIFGGPGNDFLESNLAGGAGINLSGDAGNDVIVSLDPGFPGSTSVGGGAGNDLAILLDGSIDGFQPGETLGAPLPGTPCSFAAGDDTISVSCELLDGLTITINNAGAVTYSTRIQEIAEMALAIWEGSGLPADTCYCDKRIPGFPASVGDIIL
jgi:Ca2+-binding RTX toxin-like protein